MAALIFPEACVMSSRSRRREAESTPPEISQLPGQTQDFFSELVISIYGTVICTDSVHTTMRVLNRVLK